MKRQSINYIEAPQLREGLPKFRAGDTVAVTVLIQVDPENNKVREQEFSGVVIAMRHRGLNSSFTVRKTVLGESIERVFQMHSPNIRIQVVKYGRVARAKLYYLRELTGKKARIRERIVKTKKTLQAPADV